MELQTAIEILEYHQEWRLGKRQDMIHEPQKLTEALDIILSEVKNIRVGAVNSPLRLVSAIKEIENAMERWHHGRDEDGETLQKINDNLVDIGLLGWFNKQ